jgi:hypothetical protein
VGGCTGTTSSEAPQEKQQGHTEATTKEQTRSPEATEAEEARCEGTSTTKNPMAGGTYITNDLPGCPKGGLLEGTDKHNHMVDQLFGKDGDDEISGLGGPDWLYGGPGSDVIYGGPGDDSFLAGDEGEDVIYGGDGNDRLSGLQPPPPGRLPAQRDELYCGEGRDKYTADKLDYVDSSCEKKLPPYGSQA